MTDWQPLLFHPLYREYVWGGRRLATVLRKTLGDGPRYAESWELVDHGEDQSVVCEGPLAGQTLHQLVDQHSDPLLGRHAGADRFPLLFKFLDANQALSLQVHPNDRQAAQLDPPDLGKTEAWVVLHAEPGAVLYAGLQAGVTQQQLRQALSAGQGAELMHQLQPQVGDCVFIPAGLPHALGAGLVIAEIQQASDTTFRLHDWNRLGVDGQPRTLHLEQGLAVIDYQRGPVSPQVPVATDDPARSRLVACDKFVLDRLQLNAPRSLGADQRFHILSVIDGDAEIRWHNGRRPLKLGQTTLLPAVLAAEVLPIGAATLLDMYLP